MLVPNSCSVRFASRNRAFDTSPWPSSVRFAPRNRALDTSQERKGNQRLWANSGSVLIFSLEGTDLVLTPSSEPHLPERSYRYQSGAITIGSGDSCDLKIPNPRVASMHARIERNELGIILSDLGSPEGTYLNGRRIVRARLQPGDHIQLATGAAAASPTVGQTVLGSKTFAVKPIPDIKSGGRESLVGQQGLLHLSAALARPGAIEEKLDEILDFSLRVGSFDRAAIWVVDPDDPVTFVVFARRDGRLVEEGAEVLPEPAQGGIHRLVHRGHPGSRIVW